MTTILIIDDEPLVRESMTAYLEDGGYQILEACDGASGLALIKQQAIDLILCDIHMPGIDGLQVLDYVKSHHPKTPLIMISGAGVLHDVVEALKKGAWDYLIKPIVDLAVLDHALSKALATARLVQENEGYQRELEQKNLQLERTLRELERDVEAGRVVQSRLLPESQRSFGEYTFGHHWVPSFHLSGDFVDYFPVDDNRVGFYIADVSGHGASSAFVTVLLQSWVEKFCRQSGEIHSHAWPGGFLQAIGKETYAAHLGKYLTMCAGLLELERGRLYYAIAGHLPTPILWDGKRASYVHGRGFPVGVLEDATYDGHQLALPETFNLMLFSDGILEILEGDSLDARLEKLLQTVECQAHNNMDPFFTAMDKHHPKPDDLALLTLSRGLYE